MIIEGKNAVTEALNSDTTAEKLYIEKGLRGGVVDKIIATARERKIVVTFADKTVLDRLSPSGRHQGVLLAATDYKYFELEDVFAFAQSRGEQPFILILDGITDVHNLGSIVRTAECAGVHGIVIPKRRAATVNDTVIKVSEGATQHMRIVKVNNVNDAIREVKERGLTVYGADMDGEPMYSANLRGAVAMVIGSEDEGIKQLTLKLCDGVVSIPMHGQINSLNASVAAAIVVYEKVRQDTH